MDKKPFKPLVVGAPRSGFALLASVVIHFLPLGAREDDPRQDVLNLLLRGVGDHVSRAVVDRFAAHGVTRELLFNPNFRYVAGGPKWIPRENPDEACFRKYIGVRGRGDFTLITRHPREVLHLDEVIHSHTDPALWLAHPAYAGHTKFASVRNPVDILNSSVFSLNALASEYIQKFLTPEQDNDSIRQDLALYKFTDLDFFSGLARFLASYLDEFLEVADRYVLMRWEDLINTPAATIERLAREAGVDLPQSFATQLWRKLDHVNLTQAHKHNYRAGHGKVGGWRNWITNHHLRLVDEMGLSRHMRALGYGDIEPLDEARYTPFQRAVSACIDAGRVHRDFFDPDLFTFAFNKSNLDSEKFPFKRHGWREHTRIERSIFTDEALEQSVWDAAEAACAELNALVRDWLGESAAHAPERWPGLLDRLEAGHGKTLGAADPKGYAAAFAAARERVRPVPARIPRNHIPEKGHHVRKLSFFQQSAADCLRQLGAADLPAGARAVFHTWNRMAAEVVRKAGKGAPLALLTPDGQTAPAGVAGVCALSPGDALILNETDPHTLSALLLEHLDDADCTLLAPVTANFWRNRPLMLISVPKGGTHLLYRLAAAAGYGQGVVHHGDPEPGNWYCVEYSNSHTVARDFFIDSVRREPFGNRHHPFPRTPALFIYRNPLDVVVSEANYYHREEATVFSSYLRHLDFEGRLLRLVDDPYLLGSIRDRTVNFLPWFDFENVIPVSFEELIGTRGGGDDAVRDRLIWSLQLKLHIPGEPGAIAAQIFDENSPTFHEGRIGSSRTKMTPAAMARFAGLDQDFMRVSGYSDGRTPGRGEEFWAGINTIPARAEEFRKRPMRTSAVDHREAPIGVETGYLGHNLVRYEGRYVAVPLHVGPIDLTDPRLRRALSLFLSAKDVNELKRKIQAQGEVE